jgi:hypothetical protein
MKDGLVCTAELRGFGPLHRQEMHDFAEKPPPKEASRALAIHHPYLTSSNKLSLYEVAWISNLYLIHEMDLKLR